MLGLMATSDIAPTFNALLRDCHFDIGISSLEGEYGRNEDYCTASETDGGRRLVLALADGIGSEPHGRTISRIACLALMAELSDGARVREAFGAGLREVRTFLREANAPYSGTSLLAAECAGGHLAIASVGDCRAALIRDSRLRWLNRPDRVPGTTRLTSSVGADMVTRPHVIEHEIAEGDTLVFMTDGVFDTLDSETIVEIVDAAPMASVAAKSLVKRARRTSRDDVTAAVIRFC